MTETPVSRLILRLGLPTTVSMLITSIYNMVDTYFVGTLGISQQGATGVLYTLQFIIQAFAFLLGHGSGTYVSKALADKNIREASQYVSTAFFTGAVFGSALAVVGLVFLSPLMTLLGSTPTILPYARDYGLWVLLSCPFMVCSLVLNNNLRYEGKAFFAMIGLVSGALLNIFGDYIFIFRMDLGVYGAGLSTALSQLVSFVILLILYVKMAQSSLSLRSVSRKWKVYWEIIRSGLPSLLRQSLASLSNGLLNNLAKPFGDVAISAMSVVNRFSSFAMCVGLGVSQGLQPVASFNFRAKKFQRVKKGLIFTTLVGLCIVGAMALAGLVFAEEIVVYLQKDPAVLPMGKAALRYACAGLLFLPLSVPVNMLYQSIRKSGVSSFLSLMRSGLCFIPVLALGVHFFGLLGIQTAQPIADVLTGLISIPFFVHFLRKDYSKQDAT